MANEKTIKVFLASSEELRVDRLEFSDLINKLNNIYRNRGIYFELLRWQGLDASISATRKQSEYNEVVRGSDLFLALFHTKAGAFTLEEFETAYNEFLKSNDKPKIYTYFKELEGGQTEEESLVEFKRKLMDELGHYYCRYGNQDTMLLHFVLQIKVLNLDTAPEIKVEESKISIDGQSVIDLSMVPFLNRNKGYVERKEQLVNLVEKYLIAQERSRKYPDDSSFLAEAIRISEERIALKKELNAFEQNTVALAEKLLELSAGSITSSRLRKAQEYFENGDIAGANAILDYKEISDDIDLVASSIDRKLVLIEEDKKQLSIYVEELLTKANALLLDLTNTNRFAEVEECYVKATDIEERFQLGGKALLKYCEYLYKQRDYKNAEKQQLRYQSWAINEAKKNHIKCSPELATSQNNLGILYADTNRMQKAEEQYLAMLTTCQALAEQNPAAYLSYVATSQNNLGALYVANNRMQEAEEQFLTSLATYQTLAEKNPSAYLPNVASSQNNLGNLYSATNRMQEAEEQYLASLATRKALAEENPGAYLPYLASSQNNLGILYKATNRMQEAEEQYLAALATWRALAEGNPGAYLPNVAMSQNNLGNLYADTNRMKEAEEQYLAALATYQTLAEEDPSAYLPDVAMCQNNLGLLYQNINRMQEAEEQYLAALATWKALAEGNPGAYLPNVAMSQNNLGNLYSDTNRMKEGEEQYLASLATYQTLAEENPSAYQPNVAMCQNNLGILYSEINRMQEAEEQCLASLGLYEKLMKGAPDAYVTEYRTVKRNLELLQK